MILLSNGTNERVIASHLEHLRGTHPVYKRIVHSKEEAREALTHREVDCIILDLVSISAVETYLRNESTSGQTPAIVLLAPRSQMESETAKKKWKQISSSAVHFLGTPLRQLSLAYELQTILDSYLITSSKGKKETSDGREGKGEEAMTMQVYALIFSKTSFLKKNNICYTAKK